MNQETKINIRWRTGKLYLDDTVVGIVYAEAGGHTAIFHYPPIPDMQSPKVRNRLIKAAFLRPIVGCPERYDPKTRLSSRSRFCLS